MMLLFSFGWLGVVFRGLPTPPPRARVKFGEASLDNPKGRGSAG